MHTPISANLPAVLSLAICCNASLMAANETPKTDTHQSLAQELLLIMSDTEAQLSNCTDAATVDAAIPHLLELSKQAQQLKQRQKELPEPTVQDYLAAQSLVGDFNTLVQAIEQHIARLQKLQIISPQLSKILGLVK